jgi:hypothetical protein
MSAIWAAVAVGLLSVVCASVTRSIGAGAVAALLLAFSYTFWTQAVIAEVYSLHLTLVAVCLLVLHAYATKPTMSRLLLFTAVYAAAFGNHLGMVLLLVPFAIFVLQVTPDRRMLLRPVVIAAVLSLAVAGALQYTPNFLAVWASLNAPDAWIERIATFWFDTTKQDWRESMVFGVHSSELGDRLAMWAFDARAQFGAAGLGLAAIGIVQLWRTARPWALLSHTIYGLNTIFALTYNVGDTHVFFLPGHLVTALCAGAGVTLLVRGARLDGPFPRAGIAQFSVVLLVLGYAGWRGWTTWPLADRHEDRRGAQVIAQLTAGITDRDALLVSRMDWQLENVLFYTARYLRDDLAWVRLGDVILHWPFLVDDTHRLGRDIVMTADAAADVFAAYGASPTVEDPSVSAAPLTDVAARIPRGMPYVLCILTPPPGYAIDQAALDETITALTGGRTSRMPAAFEVIAGIAGDAPQIHRSSRHPFTMRFRLLDESLALHLDGWLPFETFRRAGFGHVLRGRTRLLAVERGVSLVWLGRDGRPSPPHYAAGLFAPQPRFRVPAATLQLASQRVDNPVSRPFRPSWHWREP